MALNKKSEGLTLNVIVIAVLVLLVLIVLILIFSGRLGLFNQGINQCPPGSQDDKPLPKCAEGVIPSKVVSEKGVLMYCCPTPT